MFFKHKNKISYNVFCIIKFCIIYYSIEKLQNKQKYRNIRI